MTQLPIKARVLEYYAVNDKPVTALELSHILENEYAGEKTVKPDHLEKQILCYCRVGMLEPCGVKEENGEQWLEYQVTASGRAELAYIPGHGNKIL